MEPIGCSKEIVTLLLFPGALGDFVCLLPALRALRDSISGRMVVVARGEWLELLQLHDTERLSIDRREIADLFVAGDELAPATVALLNGFRHAYSWTGYGDANFYRRLGLLGKGSVEIFPFRGMQAGEHAAAYYARCVGVRESRASTEDLESSLRLQSCIARDQDWLASFVADHDLSQRRLLVVHPGSGSAKKNWPGFAAALALWRRDASADWVVVELRGPAEPPQARLADALRLEGISLKQVAALLTRADAYLGNDSGISHLAGAVGTRGVVVFGPSDPDIWRPLGQTLEILHRREPCPKCGDVLCLHRLTPAEVARRIARVAATASSDIR